MQPDAVLNQMRVLSPIFHRAVYPALGSSGYFHSRFAPSSIVSVVTYHGVLPSGYERAYPDLDNTLVNPASFRCQLRLLKEHYNVISPEQFRQWLRQQDELPERAILLTCDDGLLNHLTTMLPILQEEELRCLFFVTGASLGDEPGILWYMELYLMLMKAPAQDQPVVLRGIAIPRIPADRVQRNALWQELMKTLSRLDDCGRRDFMQEARASLGSPAWRTRLRDDPLLRDRFQLLRPSELKQLADAGMTIGAHTLSHPVLAEQSFDLSRSEILECRTAMERCLGKPVWAVAYPFGTLSSVSEREYRLAQEAGYECAFMNVGGTLKSDVARLAFPRVHITAEMSLPVYEAYVSGFHNALRGWLRS